MIFSFIAIIIFALIWYIITILLCIWVYRDAEKRGMNGVLWLLIVVVGGVIGLIVYLLVREVDKAAKATAPPLLP